MRTWVKRFLTMAIAAALVFTSLEINLLSVPAEETDNFTAVFSVEYDQTEARSMLYYINSFREGNDVDGQSADYLNPDNETRTDLTGKLSPLIYDYGLERAAMQRAAELVVSYSHVRPDGSPSYTAWPEEVLWDGMGENIAAGYGSFKTAYSVFIGWRQDNYSFSGQGHRRNMLYANYNKVGIAHANYNGVDYWALAFGIGYGDSYETEAVDGI